MRTAVQALWQPVDLTACFVLRNLKVVSRLQGHPVLQFVAEPVGDAACGVARDGALAIHDLRDPVGGYVKLPGQLGQRYAEGRKFVRQDFDRVMGRSSHRVIFAGVAQWHWVHCHSGL